MLKTEFVKRRAYKVQHHVRFIDDLIKDFKAKLSVFEGLVLSPSLFVSEFFFSLRNELDIDTEKALLEIQAYETSDQQAETPTADKTRSKIIDSLKALEKICLQNLEDTRRSQLVTKLDQYKSGLRSCEQAAESEKDVRKIDQLFDTVLEALMDLETDIDSLSFQLLSNNTVFLLKPSTVMALIIIQGVHLRPFEITYIK